MGVDQVLRWCAESLVAVGASTEHAILLGSIAGRLADLQPVDAALARFVSDLESIQAGALPVVPRHRAERLSETTLHIDAVGAHEVFAIHAGLEFVLHAAVLHGWGAVDLGGLRRGDALLVFAPQVVHQGLSMLAVRTDAPGCAHAASMVTLGSPDARDSPVVDVPARLLSTAVMDTHAASLGAALRDTGVSLELPEPFIRDRASSLQLCVFDPEHFPREAGLIHLRLEDAANLPGAARLTLPSHADMLIGEDLRTQISRLSHRLHVFDPFQPA